jgi:hypothetical protein
MNLSLKKERRGRMSFEAQALCAIVPKAGTWSSNITFPLL